MSKLSSIFLSLASVSSLIIDSFHSSLCKLSSTFKCQWIKSSPLPPFSLPLPLPSLSLSKLQLMQSVLSHFFLQPLSFVGWVSCIFLFSLIPKSSDFPNGSGNETTPFYPLVNVICRFLVLCNINTMSPPFSFSAVVPVHGNGAREVGVYFIPELELYLPACCCLKLSMQWKVSSINFC